MKLIDVEVRKLVDEGYATASRILTERREDLERLAQGLLEYETLTGDEIRKLLAGEPLRNDKDDERDASSNAGVQLPKTRKPLHGWRDGAGGVDRMPQSPTSPA